MNSQQLRIWRDFVETGDELRALLASRLLAESDLSTADYSVLLALSEADGRRMRSSELADHVGWERSRLSHHLGRMESRGLVGREKCLTDSRGSEIVLIATGASLFRRASAPHLRAVQELFLDALDEDLLAKVDDVTRALRAHINSR
ncbi:MarR family transcriptional regulator [Glaciihabitans arcticus]|uniref:MarR family transcriptional regulator n=1 Tax=Glaciihabitans arcticus TaxID=2668039 RepID=A0A4V2JF75_9MICO|nr:MarR family winged helix-turn-helix transcriptional regulator [Glaciihabitans arcticus]TBN58369.1 MarR family transcriptional regulator [Glaciihabitans arcticus]